MKKLLIPIIILAVIGFGLYNWAVGFNNTAVEHEADAKLLGLMLKVLISVETI